MTSRFFSVTKKGKVMKEMRDTVKDIYLAGGCFWGLEEYFSRIGGVIDVKSGYANGKTEETDYQRIGMTDHAETVHVIYDESRLTLKEILLYYLRVIDPT